MTNSDQFNHSGPVIVTKFFARVVLWLRLLRLWLWLCGLWFWSRWGWLRWLPLAVAMSWGLAEVATGGPLLGPMAVVGGAALGAGWLVGRGWWPTALLFAALAAPIAWSQWVLVPSVAAVLVKDGPAKAQGPLRVTGIVRQHSPAMVLDRKGHKVLLGEVTLEQSGSHWRVPELSARFSARWRPWQSYRQHLRISGTPETVARVDGRLELTFARAQVGLLDRPLAPKGREWLRQAFADRAGYYLGNRAHALYLPILLGIRTNRSPEGRAVAATFRRVGVAHLFAISGLHVGLLFVLFLAVLHGVSRLVRRGQGSIHGRPALRVAAAVLIWGYVALIGFPVPALRAALMVTVLIWSGLIGTRSPPFYVLGLVALALLCWDVSQVHDVSFQLSFLAYLFVMVGLLLWDHRPQRGYRRGVSRWARMRRAGVPLVTATVLNLLITLTITIGLWPVMVGTFGRISLLVFIGNLLMVPLLSLLVLPSGILALVVSALYLGTRPGGWLERVVFGWLDLTLRAWIAIADMIDKFGQGWVLQIDLAWPPLGFVLYYLGLGGGLWGLMRWLRRRHSSPRTVHQERTGPGEDLSATRGI